MYTKLLFTWDYILPRHLRLCKKAINILLLKIGYFNWFIIYPSCERALKNGSVKSIIENRLWTSLLARVAVLYQNLLGQTQTKPYWSKIFLRFGIAILNNNFVFRMMSSFCSMARVAGCILAREMIKCANVFYSACL